MQATPVAATDFCSVLEEWFEAKKKLDAARAWFNESDLQRKYAHLIASEGDARNALNALFQQGDS